MPDDRRTIEMKSWIFGKCGLITLLAAATCLYVVAFYFDLRIQNFLPMFKNIVLLSRPQLNQTTKKILYWNTMFGDPTFYFGDEPFRGCPVNDCYATHSRDFGDEETEFDALLFHANELDVYDLPKKRGPGQWYFFVNLESPKNRPISNPQFEDYFNATFTYRLDSDVMWSYGVVKDLETGEVVAPARNVSWKEPPSNDTRSEEAEGQSTLSEVIRGKRKLVIWFVSNCSAKSGRMQYVKELSKHIEIDIYGRCGTHTCLHSQQCIREVAEPNYFFYLSFENTFCQDYVTEKLYKPLRYNIVPVVYGGVNYSYFAPPNSYVNALDFESPKDLAAYLKALAANPREYEKYFLWKRRYEVDTTSKYAACNLCKFLHERKKPKIYSPLSDWYSKDKCPLHELLSDAPYLTKLAKLT